MTEVQDREITGVLLVGGKSRRMGRDKAFLEVGGKPLFERALDLFTASFAQVFLVGNRAERFESYGLPILPDIYPGSSLGGLYTGLYHASSEHVFVSSCDLPFPNSKVLNYLCSLRDGFDAVVPHSTNGYEPLFALYSKNCLGPIKAQLDRGEFCAYSYYPEIRVRFVSQEELADLDPEGLAFLNLNTPAEYANIGGNK